MKYNEKYPDKSDTIRPLTLGPHQPKLAEDDLYQTGRFYPCWTCKIPTGWVRMLEDSLLHICSEECLKECVINQTQEASIENVTG